MGQQLVSCVCVCAYVLVIDVYTCNCHTQSSAAPDDYETIMRVLEFSSTTQNITIPVPLKADGLFENVELVITELSVVTTNLSVIVDPPHSNITIIDTDGRFDFVTITISVHDSIPLYFQLLQLASKLRLS